MFEELFSKRYSLRPTPQGLIYDDIPDSARIGLFYILEEFLKYVNPVDLYSDICIALRVPVLVRNRDITSYHKDMSTPIHEIIMSCEWWRCYDICEVMNNKLHFTGYNSNYVKKINELFIDEQLGFELRKDKIEKIGSGYIDAKIKEARYLLKEPEFKGADQHFEKAVKAINIRPNPDVENCIKDAVSAIESVGRIIAGDEKALLSDIIKDAAKKGIIPQPLDQTFQKVYAYRGNEPGVAHGAVDASKVTV
ncbi:MAG: hypothetical protein WC369_06470, partial [Dehalococcoidales bacterium]